MRRQPHMRQQIHRLIFLDATGTTIKMTRLRGRARSGVRLKATAPFGHWATQTFIAGLRCDGLVAAWVIDHPMTRETFDIYVETELAPALQKGDVVILDNLPSHKSAKAEAMLRQLKDAGYACDQALDALGSFLRRTLTLLCPLIPTDRTHDATAHAR